MAIDKDVTDPGLASVLQISDQAREQAIAVADLINKASSGRASAEAQAEIAKQHKHLVTNISHLRGLHRSACVSARETKAATAEARQEIDRLHLQLQRSLLRATAFARRDLGLRVLRVSNTSQPYLARSNYKPARTSC